MKYFSYPVILLLLLQLFSQQSMAQLFPGIKVNGRTVTEGDTINVCKGNSLTYESIATGANSIFWRFKLGSPATSNSFAIQTVTYNTVGIDSTVQKIFDAGNSDSMWIIVRVSDIKPIVNYNFVPDNVCGNIPIVFNNTSTGQGNSYSWNFDDGSSTRTVSPTHLFLSAIGSGGTQVFNVKLVATNFWGCKDSIIKPVTIIKIPDAAIGNADPGVTFTTSNATFKVCTNTPSYLFKFINQSTTIASNLSYSISWGDNTADSNFTSWPLGDIIQHRYTIGSRILTVTVTGPNGCIGIKKYTVFLGTNPAGGFSSLGNTNICSPDSLRFVITGYQNNAPGTIYTVTVNDGSAPQVFSHPPPDTVTHYFVLSSCGSTSSNGFTSFSNSFSAILTIENPCDLTSVSVIPIYVSGKPRPGIQVSPSNTVCTNSTTTIRSTSNYGGIVTSTGGGTSTCTNTGKQVWAITPTTGFNIISGSLGSLNNNTANGFIWTSGSLQMDVVFTVVGTYTIKIYVFNERCGIDSTEQTICVRNPPQAAFTMSNRSACIYGTTVISNNSIPGLCLGDGYNWTITYLDPMGCGNSSTTNYNFINGTNNSSLNPELEFLSPGKYAIKLTTGAIGTNASCQPASKIDTFTVKGKPKVGISPVNNICANNTISPTATISPCYADSALQYLWNFTNGAPLTVSTANPGSINYSQLGIHPIKLTVTNECGSTADSTSVSVIAPPLANAGLDKTICSRAGINIGTTGTPGVTYKWTPVTGLSNSNSDITTVSLIYTGVNADSIYVYVLTASEGINCSTTDTVFVTVKKRPVVTVSPVSANICAGLNTQLVAAGAVTYNWFPATGLNVTNIDTVIASPASTTIYSVSGTTINSCSDTASVTVTIQPYPVTEAGNDSIVCNNTNAVQLIGTPSGGFWSGSNVTSGGLFNPQAAGNGMYVLKYTAALNQCSKTDSLTVTVIDPPIAFAGNDTTVCQNNNTLNFSASPSGGSWSGSAFVTATGVFSPTNPGLYELIYTFGSGSCISKDTINVTVKNAITNNSISPNQSVCINTQPAPINGLLAIGGDGTPAYQWQQSTDSLSWTNITGATGVNFTPPVLTLTTFYRRLAFTTLCAGTNGSTSITVKITIRQNSIAQFSASQTVGCSPYDLSTVINVTTYPDRNGQYKWFADNVLFGSNSSGIFPGYIIPTSDDTVVIKLVTLSQYGCQPDTTAVQFITVTTSFAKFTKDTAGGCGPITVSFNNTSSLINNNIQFFWNFGNGITSTLQQPGSVIFTSSPFFADTTYYVSLKVYNGCDTTLWRDSIKIRSNPKARFGVLTTFGCSPFTVKISNTSLGGPNTYYWDFGNGHKDTTFATGPLSYTYNIGNTVDTFIIRLIAVNECGSDTQKLVIRIAPNIIRPQVNINSSELFGCAPHLVGFINSTSGASSYTWNFGDGTAPLITNNSQNIVPHTYTDSGTYTVRIDMTNGCSDTTVFRQLTVYLKPIAAFTPSASVYCLGDTIKVINSSANANSYRWFWGDGQTSVGPNPTHVYAVAGNYIIYLRAEKSNSSGVVCYDTLIRPITVLIRPNVTIQTNIAAVNCAPFNLTATAPGIINETATWYVYDSTVTPSLISNTGIATQHTFNNPGTFYVKFIAINTLGCKDSSIINFTVRGTPVASFTPGNLSICKIDTTISFQNTSTYNDNGPLIYKWVVDNLTLSNFGNFTHRYTAAAGTILPKTFTTKLIATNTVGCSDTAIATLQMSPTAKAQFSINNPNTCVPFIVSLNNTSQYTTKQNWYVNGLLVDTTANPVITITQALTPYTITLIADNIYGCKPDTFSTTFTSRKRPVAKFIVSDTLGCTGVLNIATTNQSSNANFYLWNWGDNSSNSSFTNPTHLYNIPGQYLITLVASDGVCSDTTSRMVRVSVKPKADFSVSDTLTCDTARVQFTNLTQFGNSYKWSFSDGTNSTEINPAKSFSPSLTPYTIKLVADNGLGCLDSIVKPNLVLAKKIPVADFFISPTAVITVPNYTFSFNNLTVASSNYLYQWNLGDGTFASTRDIVLHKYTDTGNYPIQLVVLDSKTNCTDTAFKIARIDGYPGWLYVPNAICPACIQSNLREFLPKGQGLEQYLLQIFTTWGELIFQSSSLDAAGTPNQSWDGRFKGILVQQDVYVWKIQAKFKNGSEWLGMIYPGENKLKKAWTITVVK